jgi:hypothetical protein
MTNKRQKSVNAIFVETCWRHVFSQLSLSLSLSLSVHYDLVALEGELVRVVSRVLSTWWRSQEKMRPSLERWRI